VTRWLFDLGNTRLKVAPLAADGRRGEVLSLAHRDTGLAGGLDQLLPQRIETAYVASVAGDAARTALLQALASRCRRISVARTLRGWQGLRIAYPEPERLGVDRFLALLGQHAKGEGAALVCGVGTALTLDLLDGEGRHRGGRIAPSPTLMREALHARAAHLPVDGGRYREFADDTVDALASGCDGAALGLVGDTLDAAARVLGAAPRLVLHGGGAEALAPRLAAATLKPHLVLDGLAHWAGADAEA
jgi:type III pantothenate kinase